MILLDTIGVDNASTDGNPERILEKYGDQVTLLQNAENLGGSGGFNTGVINEQISFQNTQQALKKRIFELSKWNFSNIATQYVEKISIEKP